MAKRVSNTKSAANAAQHLLHEWRLAQARCTVAVLEACDDEKAVDLAATTCDELLKNIEARMLEADADDVDDLIAMVRMAVAILESYEDSGSVPRSARATALLNRLPMQIVQLGRRIVELTEKGQAPHV
jgi:hypothetical protein